MTVTAGATAEYDRYFLRRALLIGLPIVIQHLLGISLNMIDTMMIGKLGVAQLSAVGAATRVYSVFGIVCFGFYSGASVHLAQYWGLRDVANIRRILGIDYLFGGLTALIFMLIAFLFAPQILSLFADEAAVIDYGVRYLRIVQFSYLLTAFSFVITFNSRAIHRLLVPTAINVMALGINTFFNYCLIYGHFGFPMLGVEGAAIATVFARLVEFIALVIYVYRSREHPLAAPLQELFRLDRELTRRVMRTVRPVVISEGTWSIGTAVYYIAYGMVGEAAIAVVQVSAIVNELFLSVFFGIGNASAVMIGNELGRGNKDKADRYARLFIRTAFATCLVITLLFWLCRGAVIRFYAFDPATSLLLEQTLLVYIIFATPRMLTYTLFIGVLRAGGDTRFTMILDVLGIWCVGVPLAFLGAAALGWELPYVVALSLVEEVVKMFICFHRIRSKKWINVLI